LSAAVAARGGCGARGARKGPRLHSPSIGIDLFAAIGVIAGSSVFVVSFLVYSCVGVSLHLLIPTSINSMYRETVSLLLPKFYSQFVQTETMLTVGEGGRVWGCPRVIALASVDVCTIVLANSVFMPPPTMLGRIQHPYAGSTANPLSSSLTIPG
jgi:hypothetical protein